MLQRKGNYRHFFVKSISSAIFMILVGCGSEKLNVPTQEAFQPSFSSIRDRIFIPRCINCHSGIVSHKILLSSNQTEAMIVPGNAEKSRIYTSVRDHEMPQYGQNLTDEEVSIIKTWIDSGANDD